MIKLLQITVCLFLFFGSARGQDKKFIYIDSTLLDKNGEKKEELPDENLQVVPADEERADFEDEQAQEESPDTSLFTYPFSMSADSIKNWKRDKDLAYANYLDSLLKEKKKEINNEVSPRPRMGIINRFLNSGFVKVLLWSLAIFFIGFLLYRLFLTQGAFKRKGKSLLAVEELLLEEEINADTDFNALIRTAEQNSNYRLAIRWHYLQVLQSLAEKNILQLEPEKTNYQYGQEISINALKSPFSSLLLVFEYVWYGELEIDENRYSKLKNDFSDFKVKIKN